jgi:antitoxin component YwqK of YwqJK toxin-antitoxin module
METNEPCITYGENGEIVAKYYLVNDQLHGKYISYTHQGTIITSILPFKKGKLDGACYFFDEQGSKTQAATFRGGKLHGRMLMYTDAVITLYSYYVDGYLNGKSFAFYPDRNIQSEMHYIAGKLNGITCFYDMQGNKINESHYNNGKLDGTSLTYNIEGDLLIEEQFSQGKSVGVENVE